MFRTRVLRLNKRRNMKVLHIERETQNVMFIVSQLATTYKSCALYTVKSEKMAGIEDMRAFCVLNYHVYQSVIVV